MSRKLFSVMLGLAAIAAMGCSSTSESTRNSGGGEYLGWSALARTVQGQNTPSGQPEDPVPVLEWDEPVTRPNPPAEPEKPVVEPPKVVVTPEPKPLPRPLPPLNEYDPASMPSLDSNDDNAAMAYDQLKRAARPKGNDGARFVPAVRKASNGVESLTQYYKRMLQKLNPGF